MSNNQREKTENRKLIDNTDAEINRHFEWGTKHAQERTEEARASFHIYSKSLWRETESEGAREISLIRVRKEGAKNYATLIAGFYESE